MYAEGTGTAVDKTQAMKWISEAANQNMVEAEFALGEIYVRGSGTPKDDVNAYIWFNRAAGQGYRPAIKVVSDMTKTMTPEQLSAAKQQIGMKKP